MVGRIKRDNLQRANCWLGRKKPHLLTLYCTISTELTRGFTTYPLVDEAPGLQALHFKKQVLTNRAVIAPPGEGSQVSQEASSSPAGRNRGLGSGPSSSLWAPSPWRSHVSGVMGLGPWRCVLLGPCHDHKPTLQDGFWVAVLLLCELYSPYQGRPLSTWPHSLICPGPSMCLAWQGDTVPFTELVVWTERLNMNVSNHSFANYIKFFFSEGAESLV